MRIARIELLTRRAQPWTDLPLHGFARNFDGRTWFVAEDGALAAIDVEGEQPRARWRIDRLGVAPVRVTRDAGELSFIVPWPDGGELWTYQLPQLGLRRRQGVADGLPLAISSSGNLRACLQAAAADPTAIEVCLVDPGARITLSRPAEGVPIAAELGEGWTVVVVDLGDGMAVFAYPTPATSPTRSLRLAGARAVHVRLATDLLTVGDDLGRLVTLHLPTGATLCDLRLHP